MADAARIDEEAGGATWKACSRIVALGRACRNGASAQEPPAAGRDVCEGARKMLDGFYMDIIRGGAERQRGASSPKRWSSFMTYNFKPQLKTAWPQIRQAAGQDPRGVWRTWTARGGQGHPGQRRHADASTLVEERSGADRRRICSSRQRSGRASAAVSDRDITVAIDTDADARR